MATTLDWVKEKPSWVGDALKRLASKDALSTEDEEQVYRRIKKANGFEVEGELVCQLIAEEDLTDTSAAAQTVLIRGIGPLINVDRLRADQELVFAKSGITLIFGENASGKSGYARAGRRICNARVDTALQGNVFSLLPGPPAKVHFRYDEGGQADVQGIWTEGDDKPSALAAITILDAENARVYIERENEILFVPYQIRLLTRLGGIFSQMAQRFLGEINSAEQACPEPYGTAFNSQTPAGLHVRLLRRDASLANLPSATKLKELGTWTEGDAKELAALHAAISQSPAARALRLRRLSESLASVGKALEVAQSKLDTKAISDISSKLAAQTTTAEAVTVFAAEKMETLPIAGTGSPAWKLLFEHARKFAAEAGLRTLADDFRPGDPCPLCQVPLDAAAAVRMKDFDDFVGGEANQAAAAAAQAVASLLTELTQLALKQGSEIKQLLAEYEASGEKGSQLAGQLVAYQSALIARRDALVQGIKVLQLPELTPLPSSPVAATLQESQALATQATQLETEKADTAAEKRLLELSDQKLLHSQLDDVLKRRAVLVERLRLLDCQSAVATGDLSRLVSKLRGELVTPDLRKRIEAEIKGLKLEHIPFKFHEATEKGVSIFEMALDTASKQRKGKVLSEGEQRALSLACFLAESHVVETKMALIVDDPVTSLDHERLRRVAQRLVREAATRVQIIIFTHNLLFYQEVLRSAAEASPAIPVLKNYIYKESDDSFGVVAVDDEPWITKKVKDRIKQVDAKLANIDDSSTSTEAYRIAAKDFYSDLRECWERFVEEILLNKVVERFSSEVRTQSLRGVQVDDNDFKEVYFNMARVSEFSGHDLAAGKQVAYPPKDEMKHDLDTLKGFLALSLAKRNNLQTAREALLVAPAAEY